MRHPMPDIIWLIIRPFVTMKEMPFLHFGFTDYDLGDRRMHYSLHTADGNVHALARSIFSAMKLRRKHGWYISRILEY